MENVTDFINVAVRIKPTFSDDSTVCNLKVDSNNPNVLCLSDRHSFTFDHIFDGDADQATVFNDIIKPMVDKFLLGYNCTVFTYGQTGTGKTYTMGNPQNVDVENMGIINRTFKDIFKNVLNANVEIFTEVSLYETYNEKVFDLLDNRNVPLPVKDFTVPGLKRVPVHDLEESQELFLIASKNRKTAGTFQNAKSSRSHAIYTVFCTIRNEDSIKTSKFNFVDLAGSESVRKTGSKGNSFHEGVNINKGLLCLGQVIKALCTNQNYVPYRQTTITTVLRDSLSKKNYITLIACVSSKISDTTETLQTLDFAKRVKGISSKPEAYSVIDNSFKKPAVDLTKCWTPINTMRPIQTSTAFKMPKPVPMVASYIPNETCKYPMGMTRNQESTISISPIVRMCVEQIEAKLIRTNTIFVDEKRRKVLRRSTRISALRQNCSETIIDENDETMNTVVIKKKRRTDKQQNEVLKDITVKSYDSTDNAKAINNSNDHENLKEKNRNNWEFLFKDLSQPHVNVSKNKSKRTDPIQATSSPNVTAEYRKFTEKWEQNQQQNEDFESLTSFAFKPAPRRSMRLQANHPSTTPETTCDVCSRRKEAKRRSVEEDKVESNNIKHPGKQHHLDRVLEILNKGTLKSLTTLQTIGLKSAEQILLYRQLHGKFEMVEDVKNALIRGGHYTRFMKANFLL